MEDPLNTRVRRRNEDSDYRNGVDTLEVRGNCEQEIQFAAMVKGKIHAGQV